MTPRCLSLLVFSSLLIHVSADQRVLSSKETRNGFLRRFSIESSVQWVLDTAKEHDLDVWHASKSFVDVYSPPDEPFLPADLAKLPHTTTTLSTTPKRLGTNAEWNLTSLTNTTFHESYHPLYEINSFINQLSNAYPNITRLVNLGHSAEGREMIALRISTGPYESQGEGGKKKRRKKQKKKTPGVKEGLKMGFVIVGAQHAREWVATATSTYLAHALVADKSEPHSISSLLDHFDFYIVPVPNPDGYTYTWETDRYWYKNRQILGPYTDCVGLDMNRNWGYKWKASARGESVNKPREPTNPCSHWYPGTRPFEAPEVNNMANWITTLPNLVGFIDLRSYGQMLSSPYSYTCDRLPNDAEDQIEAALGASNKLNSIHGTDFQTGSLCSMLYPAPGNILDWMYSREAIKYSYVAHLRDTGTYGFALPAKWIRPTGEETSGLIDYLARFIAKQANRQF